MAREDDHLSVEAIGCTSTLAWLEESDLLSREENRVRVFPSSLRVNSVEEHPIHKIPDSPGLHSSKKGLFGYWRGVVV